MSLQTLQLILTTQQMVVMSLLESTAFLAQKVSSKLLDIPISMRMIETERSRSVFRRPQAKDVLESKGHILFTI